MDDIIIVEATSNNSIFINETSLGSSNYEFQLIDENGNIVDVRAKAPHPRLQKEVIRVVKLLPKIKPGRQRGKPVGVRYTLPVGIMVE